MIKRIVKLNIRDGYADDFLKIFNGISGDIASFEGCRSVQILRATGNKNVFFTISEWDSEIALDRYRNSSFFRSNWQKIKQLFSDKPEACSTIVISNY